MRAQRKFGDPGTVSALVNVTGAGILASAADSTAAEEFVAFLVSEQAQTYFLEQTYEYPLVGDLAGPEGVPPLDELGGPDIDLSELSSLQETVAQITAAAEICSFFGAVCVGSFLAPLTAGCDAAAAAAGFTSSDTTICLTG